MTRKSPIKDRPSYFRKTDQAVPELVGQQNSQHPEHPDSPDAEHPKPKRIKRTFYLQPDTVKILETVQRDEWVPGADKPELSNLVDEAIRMFAESRQQKG